MGKNKHSNDAKIALLINFDRTYKMVDIRDIKRYLLHDTNRIEYVLVPIYKYDNVNYFMIDVHRYPTDITHFEVTGSLALEGFEYGWSSNENSMNIYEKISKIFLSSNDEIGIYNMYESLSMLSYVNEIINPAYSDDDFFLFSFDDPKFTIEKREFKCINERFNTDCDTRPYTSDDHGSISRAIEILTKIVFSSRNGVSGSYTLINTNYSAIIISSNYCKFFEYGKNIRDVLRKQKSSTVKDLTVGIFSPSVGTYTFLKPVDFLILSELDSMQFQMYFYEIADGVDDISREYVTNDILEEFSDCFVENFQMNLELYGSEYLIQLLANFKCVANYIKLFSDICFGKCIDDILFNIVGIISTSKLPFAVSERCKKRYEYRYEVTFGMLNSIDDIVTDFVSKLIDELTY